MQSTVILLSMLMGCGPAAEAPDDTGTGSPCGEGQVLDSDGSCVPEACGSGTWGELEGATVFVDIAAAASGDGSQAAPYTSIQAGLDAAGAAGGGTVAVAAGSYPETLSMSSAHSGVHLAGRCRELVALDASVGGERSPGIDVQGADAEISGLTVWGAHWLGLRVGAGAVLFHDAAVVESAYLGAGAYPAGIIPPTLEIRACELVGNAGAGVLAQDAGTTITVVDSTIEGTTLNDSGGGGFGLLAYGGASLSASGSTIVASTNAAVWAEGAGTLISLTDSEIRDTQPPGGASEGIGILAADQATLLGQGLTVSDNTAVGVVAKDPGTTLRLEDSEVRATQPDPSGARGFGAQAYDGASLTLEGCELIENHSAGVFGYDEGTTLTLIDTVVRDTQPQASGLLGHGIEAQGGASLVIEGGEISGNTGAGVLLQDAGTTATIGDLSILGTLPTTDGIGAGVDVYAGASAALTTCAIDNNTAAGVHAHGEGSFAHLVDSEILGTQQSAALGFGVGVLLNAGAQATLEHCRIEDSAATGLTALGAGSGATVLDSEIRGTLPTERHPASAALMVGEGASLALERSLVEDNTGLGVWGYGSDTSVSMVEVEIGDTRPDDDGWGGRGLEIASGASLLASACTVRGSTGIAVFIAGAGTSATLDDSTLEGTSPDHTGAFGYGVEVQQQAQLHATGLTITDNTAVGLLVSHQGTHATLADSEIRDTRLGGDDRGGHAIWVSLGATLDVSDGHLEGNLNTALVARDGGTQVTLDDTTITGTGYGGVFMMGGGAASVDGAAITATDAEIRDNRGPGLQTIGLGAALSCTRCTLADNDFAGALVILDAAMELSECAIEGTGVQENLGGGVGLYAGPFEDGHPPSLLLDASTLRDNPIAGAWFGGQGSYQLTGNTIHGGEGWSRGTLTQCGDAVYAGGGVQAWDGSSGLWLSDNDLVEGLTAGLFLDDASATVQGNRYAENQVDIVQQGLACELGPEGWTSEPLRSTELCPTYDYGVCDDAFALYLTVAELGGGDDTPPEDWDLSGPQPTAPATQAAAPAMPSPLRQLPAPVLLLARSP